MEIFYEMEIFQDMEDLEQKRVEIQLEIQDMENFHDMGISRIWKNFSTWKFC